MVKIFCSECGKKLVSFAAIYWDNAEYTIMELECKNCSYIDSYEIDNWILTHKNREKMLKYLSERR